jgi:hypothetical protein
MISMTIDLEWCPTPIIQDTIQLLDEFDISATLFSTHNDKMQVEEHERALHPNFLVVLQSGLDFAAGTLN